MTERYLSNKKMEFKISFTLISCQYNKEELKYKLNSWINVTASYHNSIKSNLKMSDLKYELNVII